MIWLTLLFVGLLVVLAIFIADAIPPSKPARAKNEEVNVNKRPPPYSEIKDPKCPYCDQPLQKAPSRRSKCKNCKKTIFPRTIARSKTRVLVTSDEAKKIEKQNDEYYFENRWRRDLKTYFNIGNDQIENEIKKIKESSGYKPGMRDVVWGILQGVSLRAAKRNDLDSLKQSYFLQKRFLIDEGKDPRKLIIEAMKLDLVKGGPKVSNLKFEIMASSEACNHCKSFDGRLLTPKDGVGIIENLVMGCQDDVRYCRCTVAPKIPEHYLSDRS